MWAAKHGHSEAYGHQHGWGFFVERPTKYHRGVINMEIHGKFHGKIKEHMGKSTGKSPINGDFHGNISELNANIIEFNGGFSIAMLDFRRICGFLRPLRARKMLLFNIH